MKDKKMLMNLRLFDDPASYTVTVQNDGGFSATTASPASGAEGTKVTLAITPSTGKELDEIEVIAGGVTLEEDDGVYSFDIAKANVSLFVKSKGAADYKIVENTFTCVNGTKVELTRNMQLVKGKNGAIVDVQCNGTTLASLSADIIASLVKSGAIIKI